MITGPDQGAAARGRLRASHADREQVIDTLKTAFADSRLDADLRVHRSRRGRPRRGGQGLPVPRRARPAPGAAWAAAAP